MLNVKKRVNYSAHYIHLWRENQFFNGGKWNISRNMLSKLISRLLINLTLSHLHVILQNLKRNETWSLEPIFGGFIILYGRSFLTISPLTPTRALPLGPARWPKESPWTPRGQTSLLALVVHPLALEALLHVNRGNNRLCPHLRNPAYTPCHGRIGLPSETLASQRPKKFVRGYLSQVFSLTKQGRHGWKFMWCSESQSLKKVLYYKNSNS